MNYKIILVVFFILALTSCSSDDNGQSAPCVDVKYSVEPFSFYGCSIYDTNFAPDTYAIFRNQDDLNSMINQTCVLPLYQKDAFAGRKQLYKQLDSIEYDLIKDCETNNYKLTVTFTTNNNVLTTTALYSGVIPKMQPGETITVETIVL